MFGIPTFDLLSDRGKQEFIEYIVNLTRKEINSYTPSYNISTASSPPGDLIGDVTSTGLATSIAPNVIVNADVNSSAAIAYSKLNLTSSIVNADVSASAAIAYSKLNLTGAILNADLAGSIDPTKITGTAVITSDSRLTDARTPTGAAGGVLAGTYPNPTFSVDMATQAELDTHTSATTSVHGISNTANIVYTSDSRLTDARTPTAHAATHIPGGTDVLDYSKIVGYGTALPTFSASLHPAGVLWAVNTVGEPYALYRSDGASFLKVGGGGSITVSDTAPAGVAGNLWYDSTTGKTYIYFDSFWVEVGNTGAVDITADTIIPAGMIMPTAASVEPSGWLYCYGQNLSRTTYARLFTAVGTTYGAGDGSTTFGMPDLRGRTIAGRDNMGGTTASRLTAGVSGVTGTTLGAAGGNEALHSHTHTQNAHSHQFIPKYGGSRGTTVNMDVPGSGNDYGLDNSFIGSTTATNQNTGAGASQNVQPTIILNYLIKT
jgi:microcystin-dependent protein